MAATKTTKDPMPAELAVKPSQRLAYIMNHSGTAPDDEAAMKFERLQDGAIALGSMIELSAPGCADRTIALQKLREALFFAQTAIQFGGRG